MASFSLTLPGFQGKNLPKSLPYQRHASTPRQIHRTRLRAYHELTKPTYAGRTPTWSSVTRLSYPASLTGCPVRSRRIQISPHRPVGFLRPQQPSCGADVRPFRAAHRRGFHPLSQVPGTSGHCLPAPVSLSPNTPGHCAPHGLPGRNGSKGALQPPAPVVVAPALLEARDFSNTHPLRLAIAASRHYGGLAAPDNLKGWRPLTVTSGYATTLGVVWLHRAKSKSEKQED